MIGPDPRPERLHARTSFGVATGDRRWMGGSRPPTAPVGWMWTMVRSSHTTVFPTSSRLGLSALAGHRRRTRHTCARAPCLVLALRRPCAPSQRHQVARTAMAVDHGTARARPMTRRPRGLTRVARSTHNHTHTHTQTHAHHTEADRPAATRAQLFGYVPPAHFSAAMPDARSSAHMRMPMCGATARLLIG